jgi:histone acetyltransferase 1
VQIRLHHKAANAKSHNVTFQPAFTYPIFGDEETIFGYKNLRIKLDFEADTLRPSTSVNFTEKYKAIGDTRPDEIDEKLAPFLPSISPF